jgi:hypothetical protein
MTGRIVHQPKSVHDCWFGQDKFRWGPEQWQVGTLWECDQCQARWRVELAPFTSMPYWRLTWAEDPS